MTDDQLEEITPTGSVVPVYLDPTPLELGDPPDLAALAEEQAGAKRSAVERLRGLGFPEGEARAVVGYDGPIDQPEAP